MKRWRLAIATSLLVTACGTPLTGPTAATSTPGVRAIAPMLTVSVVSPFHDGVPGEIRYEVTGVTALASIEYSSSDGSIQFGAVMGPASAFGTLRLTYGRAGTFTLSVKATTLDGSVLEASVEVNVAAQW